MKKKINNTLLKIDFGKYVKNSHKTQQYIAEKELGISRWRLWNAFKSKEIDLARYNTTSLIIDFVADKSGKCFEDYLIK